jgi:DNA helicase HerA-like ATPase
VPDRVLGQLGNRVQHALRAFTPRDQKAVRAAAETLRANPALDASTAITELAVGEALVSCLDAHGTPAVVERAWILPPASRIGPISDAERRAVVDGSLVAGHYERAVDRESAYERLAARATAEAPEAAGRAGRDRAAPAAARPAAGSLADLLFGTTGPRGGKREGILESAARSAARSVGSGVGRQFLRGILGSLTGGRR